jgi:hypothetical protein
MNEPAAPSAARVFMVSHRSRRCATPEASVANVTYLPETTNQRNSP